jgi:hypothetical protein
VPPRCGARWGGVGIEEPALTTRVASPMDSTIHVFDLQGHTLFQQRVAPNVFLLLELFDPCVSCRRAHSGGSRYELTRDEALAHARNDCQRNGFVRIR